MSYLDNHYRRYIMTHKDQPSLRNLTIEQVVAIGHDVYDCLPEDVPTIVSKEVVRCVMRYLASQAGLDPVVCLFVYMHPLAPTPIRREDIPALLRSEDIEGYL